MSCSAGEGLPTVAGRLKESSVKSLGRDVGAVRPDDSSQFAVEADLTKKLWIAQRLENWPRELIGKVHVPASPIAEAKAQPITFEDLHLRYPDHAHILGEWLDRLQRESLNSSIPVGGEFGPMQLGPLPD